jgi:hypothetical protein
MDTNEVQELMERLYKHLDKLLWKVAWNVKDDARWQLELDEVHAELVQLIMEIAVKYAHLPFDQVLMVAKRSIRNKITDLRMQCYTSHRNVEQSMLSLDMDEESDENAEVPSMELEEAIGTDMAYFDMQDFMCSLSDDAKLLVDAVLNPVKYGKVMFHLNMAIARKEATSLSNGWHLTMTPVILQRGLGWDKLRLSKAWSQVTMALANC